MLRRRSGEFSSFDDWRLNYDAVGTADQSYTDMQAIDTEAEGAKAGTWEADVTAGMSVSSGELQAGAFDGIAHQTGRAQADGVGDIAIWKLDTGVTSQSVGGWANGVNNLGFPGWSLNSNTATAIRFGASSYNVAPAIGDSTVVHIAMIRGGYSASGATGVPFETGDTESSYTHGAALLIKGGSYTQWTLLGKCTISTATGYLNYYCISIDPSLLFLRSPDVASSLPLISPTVADRFGTNGSLDASPEATWTEQSGNWTIASGVVACNGAGIATVSANADGLIEATVNGGTDDDPGIVFRYSDSNNYWYAQLDITNNLLEIHKVSGGTDTVEASDSQTYNASTNYKLMVSLEGSVIYAWVDQQAASQATITDAHNSTETEHGLIAGTANSTYDNFAFTPRTGYNTLDTYI